MRSILYILLFSINAQYIFCQKAELQILKAKYQYDKGNYAESLQTISQAGTTSAFSQKLEGDCYLMQKQPLNALHAYLSAERTEAGCAGFEIAKCYALMSKNTEALQWLEKHLESFNKKTEAEINLEPAFQSLATTPEWKKLWQKEWYSNSDVTKSSVNSYLKYKNTSNALDLLDKSENKIYPKHEYYALRALTFIQMNLWEPASVSINKAIELNKRSHEYYAIKASIAKMLNNYTQGIEDYSKAIELNPYELSYYVERANLLILNKNFDEAENDIKIIEETGASGENVTILLAKLEVSKENYIQALKYYDRLIAMNKTKADYYKEKADLEYFLEYYQQASKDYSFALEFEPRNPELNLKMGKIYLYLLESESACFYFQKAKDYGSKEAIKLILENCNDK
jgi:tetratricopeptide (TPR) repeat protein